MNTPVALVTGASRGIGAAIARRLARSGHHVILAARSADALARVAIDCESSRIVETNLADPDSLLALARSIQTREGRLDVLIHNAGVAHVAPLGELDPESFDATWAVNVRAPWLLTRELLPLLRANGGGELGSILSVAARRVFPGWGAYCASKSALEALVRTWQLELQGSGVRVLSLFPGATDSDIWVSAGMSDVNREGMVTPEVVAEALAFMIGQNPRIRISELFIEPAGGDL